MGDSAAELTRRLKTAVEAVTTQKELIEALAPEVGAKANASNMSRWLSGERGPDLAVFAAICRATGLSADAVLGLPLPRAPEQKLDGSAVVVPELTSADLLRVPTLEARWVRWAAWLPPHMVERMTGRGDVVPGDLVSTPMPQWWSEAMACPVEGFALVDRVVDYIREGRWYVVEDVTSGRLEARRLWVDGDLFIATGGGEARGFTIRGDAVVDLALGRIVGTYYRA